MQRYIFDVSFSLQIRGTPLAADAASTDDGDTSSDTVLRSKLDFSDVANDSGGVYAVSFQWKGDKEPPHASDAAGMRRAIGVPAKKGAAPSGLHRLIWDALQKFTAEFMAL